MTYQGNNDNRNKQNYNNKGGGNKNFPPKQQVELPNLVLDYKKDTALFDTTARKWAEALQDKNKNKPTQIRNYYEKILDLEAKSQTEAWENVLPFVKMLNSKVAYGLHTKKVITNAFEKMMTQAVKQINTPEDLRVFKLFFEAVLGFFKGSN